MLNLILLGIIVKIYLVMIMKNKTVDKEVINKVTVYFYRKGQYYAIKKKDRKKAYFPEIKIDEDVNEKTKEKYRGYIVDLIHQKLFASNKIDIQLLRKNTWIKETIKVKDKVTKKKKKIEVVRIDLDDNLWNDSPLEYVLCAKDNKLVEDKCFDILESKNNKYKPIVLSLLIFFLVIISLVLNLKLDGRLLDVTAFIMLVFTIIAKSIISTIVKNRRLKLSLFWDVMINVIITSLCFVLATKVSVELLPHLENIETSLFSLISIGITLLIPVIDYYKHRKDF